MKTNLGGRRMDMSDLSWSAFIETGRVSAYLIHKNIEKRGGTRNAANKYQRHSDKREPIW